MRFLPPSFSGERARARGRVRDVALDRGREVGIFWPSGGTCRPRKFEGELTGAPNFRSAHPGGRLKKAGPGWFFPFFLFWDFFQKNFFFFFLSQTLSPF